MASSPASAHGGGVDPASLEVCETRSRSERCEYRNRDDDLYRGTCRLIADTLQRVRNRPIVRSDEGG